MRWSHSFSHLNFPKGFYEFQNEIYHTQIIHGTQSNISPIQIKLIVGIPYTENEKMGKKNLKKQLFTTFPHHLC